MAKQRRRRPLETGLVACVALLASLFAAELGLRHFAPAREVGDALSEYDPDLGTVLKPSISVSRVSAEFTMRFSTNRLGFRGPEPSGDPKGALLFLGDSFTMGYGVDDGEEFPALIRAQLGASIPVINGGIGNTGNGRWIKFLRRDGARFEPRAVILQVQENDFDDNRREGLFALSEGLLVERPVPPPSLGRRLQRWVEAIPGIASSHLVARIREAIFLVGRARGPRPADPGSAARRNTDALTYGLLRAAIDLCRARGWPVIGLLADLRGERERGIEAVFEHAGVPMARVPSKPERPDLYFDVDGHWNAAGHRAAASAVLDALRAAALVPP